MRGVKVDRTELFNVAAKLYRDGGSSKIRRDEIAKLSGYSQGTITHRLGTTAVMVADIVRHGIMAQDARIIAWAIAEGHPLVQHMTADAKTAALRKGFVG